MSGYASGALADIVLLAVQMALSIVVPWWILRWDLSRRPPEQLARAWNDATFWSAIVAFGPLCLPFHFTKTRASFLGLMLGLFWMVAASAAIAVPLTAIDWVIEDISEAGAGMKPHP